MSRAHHHPCAVPGCDKPVECSGYPVGSRYDHDLRCICEESPEPMLCENHEDWDAEDDACHRADGDLKDEAGA